MPNATRETRLLAALRELESLLTRGAHPSQALELASRVHHVDPGSLASAFLVKAVNCERARQVERELAEADARIDHYGPSRRLA